MSTIKVNGVELFYTESGRGPETIVFSHGLLMDHSMFAAQVTAFERRYRVITYDHRGQGQSQDPGSGHDMETLAEDAAALIQALNAAPCHFAGLSMGGFVGMRLAARHRQLVRTLTLMNTGAQKEETFSRKKYSFLARLVRMVGTGLFTGIAVKELFGKSTRKSQSPAKQAMLKEWTARLGSRPRNVASALMGVMNRAAVSDEELAAIRCPTLIIAGEDDTPQPPFRSQFVAARIAGSKLLKVPACGHSSSLEAPDAVTQAMQELMTGA